jgi:hypothetical protein
VARRVLVILALSMLSATAAARGQSFLAVSAFHDRPYYEPLAAEPRAARIMLVVPSWAKAFPDSVEPGSRFSWQITLGRELPIVTASTSRLDGKLTARKWGVGLWIPVAFHMIEDFKDDSNPIVDTDYRFGAMIKAQYAWTGTLRLGGRFVPWAHESTHLGDEYVLRASTNPSFERVNVSYEYREYGISLERDDLFGPGDTLTARTGGIDPLGSDGYYDPFLLGAASPSLTPSRKNFEPSVGFEYRAREWRARQAYVSVDARNRLVYTYHQTAVNPERRQWSWNVQVGRAVPFNTKGVPLKAYFVQIYRGVNPYGQLRSQADWWSIGVGWVFGQ